MGAGRQLGGVPPVFEHIGLFVLRASVSPSAAGGPVRKPVISER